MRVREKKLAWKPALFSLSPFFAGAYKWGDTDILDLHFPSAVAAAPLAACAAGGGGAGGGAADGAPDNPRTTCFGVYCYSSTVKGAVVVLHGSSATFRPTLALLVVLLCSFSISTSVEEEESGPFETSDAN